MIGVRKRRRPLEQLAEHLEEGGILLALAFVDEDEMIVRPDVDIVIEALERLGHEMGFEPLGDEEARRLGQDDGDQDRAGQAADAAGEIDAFPAMDRRDGVGQRGSGGATEAEAHHDEGNDRRAHALGHELGH